MRRFLLGHRAAIGLGLLLLIGVALAQISAAQNAPAQGGPTLSSFDAKPGGSLALALWLESQGFQVDQLQGRWGAPGDTVRYLFVLSPSQKFDQADARSVIEWIRRGGTLIYVPGVIFDPSASTPDIGDGLGHELDLSAGFGTVRPGPLSVSPGPPFFTAPRASQFQATWTFVLRPANPSWIPLVEMNDGTDTVIFVARRRYGAGQAVAIGSNDFLSNAKIGNDDNLALLLNGLARGAPYKVAAFDEYHHGVTDSTTDLLATARSQPWGWVLGYLAVLSFFFAVWSGRRFGPPIIVDQPPGRSSGDYITAFAGLLQRNVAKGSAGAWAQAQYSRLVRRGLSRTQGIRADLPAQDLARLLAERRPIDPAALSEQLGKLGGPPLSSRGLLEVVRANSTYPRTDRYRGWQSEAANHLTLPDEEQAWTFTKSGVACAPRRRRCWSAWRIPFSTSRSPC